MKYLFISVFAMSAVIGCAAQSHPYEEESADPALTPTPVFGNNTEWVGPTAKADSGCDSGSDVDSETVSETSSEASVDASLPKVIGGSCLTLTAGNLYSCEDHFVDPAPPDVAFAAFHCPESATKQNIPCNHVNSPGGCHVSCPSLSIDYTVWLYNTSVDYTKAYCDKMNPYQGCVYTWMP